MPVKNCVQFVLTFNSLVELPGYVGSIFMMDKLGRKPTLGWSLLMGGASCLTAGLIPEGDTTTFAFELYSYQWNKNPFF